MLKAILVKPGSVPEVIEYASGYRNLQKLVNGTFEMPSFFDDVDIIVNDEGKLNGSLPNKFVLFDGELVDVIYGNILISDSDSNGKAISLTDDKIRKYLKVFSRDVIYLP